MSQTNCSDINGIFNQPQQSFTCYQTNNSDICLYDVMEEIVDWVLNNSIKKQAFFTLTHKLLDRKIDNNIVSELCECLYDKNISKTAFIAIIKAFLNIPKYNFFSSGTSTDLWLNNDNQNSIVYNNYKSDNQNKANTISVSSSANNSVTVDNKLYTNYTNEGVGPEIFEPFDNIKLEGTKICMGRTKSGDWYEFDVDVDPDKFKADLGPSD